MSDKITVMGDENMKEQIIHNSKMLGISVNELIDRYMSVPIEYFFKNFLHKKYYYS